MLKHVTFWCDFYLTDHLYQVDSMKIFWSEEKYKKMLYCILNKVSSIWETEFLLREPNTVLDIFFDQIYVILGLFKRSTIWIFFLKIHACYNLLSCSLSSLVLAMPLVSFALFLYQLLNNVTFMWINMQ